jgi:hypothetical protein
VQQCKLLPGQIRTKAGECVCPRGTRLRDGECARIVQQCKLLPGQIRTKAGECVCPRGTRLVRGACRERTLTQCPQGTRLVEGRCLVIEQERCPRGTVGTPPNCRRRGIQLDPNLINPDILRELLPPPQRQQRQTAPKTFQQ